MFVCLRVHLHFDELVHAHPPAEYEVAADSEDDEEDGKDDEVDVELRVFHIKTA